ncbi:MAG: tRNA-dihydrouridine synthase family protein [FCB group bacterium]|nr:tRNA-dihydrouridine synthase family protein [FCB group bacterium]
MAGISTPAYRLLARRFGAAMVYTEMISSHGLAYKNKRTTDLLSFTAAERPLGIQLFGADPEIMYQAARLASAIEPDIIDLNFGCPVKKIVKKKRGSGGFEGYGPGSSIG